ncbi:MAG TPA: ATP-binding protein [Polyangia bacterium]|nr:ATP-binding protein [Polyangia bacterium]
MDQRKDAPDSSQQAAEPRARILIVDDHPANLVALEAILTPLGHDLVMARSGAEALRHILHGEFALILLDVQMADMNGFETASLIKQHPRSRHIPIIFITAVNRDAAHVFRGYSHGAVDYLVKPFDADILRSKAAVFIELYVRGERLKHQERLLHRREREAAERRSQERYRRLLDDMPQCIWAADAGGHVNYWNRPGLSYVGLEPDDVQEDSFWASVHPDDRPGAHADWEAGLRTGAPFERQVRLKRAADGSYRWHLARVVPEREVDGTVIGWIATATDIDDQKQAEEALRKAIILRDDFLSVASHELRTPLTSLKLEVANLSRIAQRDAGPGGAPRFLAKVEKIDSQAARLHRLIDDLLDVSRIAAGRLELHIENVDLAQIVNDVGVRFTDEAARIGSALNVHAPGPIVGRWDRSRLDQVVTNLVSNAIKYGDCKPIDVVVAGEADSAVVTIRDRGMGIAPNDHERIFGRFERAASSRHFGGIGLGLWIVKQIIDALGGTVTVESRPGDGSTFKVVLPRDPDRATARRPKTTSGPILVRSAPPAASS